MKRKTYVLMVILLFGACHYAWGQEPASKSEDNALKQAQEISAATGRPIFAVAGRST